MIVRVLVAEDDEGLRSVLQRGLEENGYAVDAVGDGELASRYLETYEYEVAILDWRMPKLSGLELIQRLRRRGSALPILMLTARDTAGDRITGLDEGADDYLVKPFDFLELLARVRALQRRGEVLQPRLIKVAKLTLDSVTREVRIGSDDPRLTAIELSLLEILIQRSPTLVSRRSIALAVWDEEADALGSNTLDVHLARLRGKIAGSGAKIESVRGLGYRVVAA
jgi:two-component system, OmpR family, response regulator